MSWKAIQGIFAISSDKLPGIKASQNIFDSWSLSTEKGRNELGVVEQLLNDLNIECSTLVGIGHKDPPDCVLAIDEAKVGVEVVNLIDIEARKLSAKSRREGGTEFYAQWTKDKFQKHLEKLVAEKDQKIRTGIKTKSAAALCEKFWLVISTDEMTLSSAAVSEFVAEWKIISDVFEAVYLILSYEPGRDDSGYVHFQLN